MVKQIVKRHNLKPLNTNFDDYYQETAGSLSPELQRLRHVIEERKRLKEEEELLRVGDNSRIVALDRYRTEAKSVNEQSLEGIRERLRWLSSPLRENPPKKPSPVNKEYVTSRFLDQVETKMRSTAKKEEGKSIWVESQRQLEESNKEVLAQINELRARLDETQQAGKRNLPLIP